MYFTFFRKHTPADTIKTCYVFIHRSNSTYTFAFCAEKNCVSFSYTVFANLKRAKMGNVTYFERIVFDVCALVFAVVCEYFLHGA